MQRRTFLRRTGALAATAMGTPALSAAVGATSVESIDVDLPAPRADVARDEAYWARVRRLYDVDPSLLDLDHGNSGLTSRRVLERYVRDVRLLNSAPNVHYPRLMSDTQTYETINGFLSPLGY